MEMPTGTDELFMCSIGSGKLPVQFKQGEVGKINVIGGALRTLKGLLASVSIEQDKLCRILEKFVHGDPIDRELGDLKDCGRELFLYSRYQHEFSGEDKERGRSEHDSKKTFELHDSASVPALWEIGKAYAESAVLPEHFPVSELRSPKVGDSP